MRSLLRILSLWLLLVPLMWPAVVPAETLILIQGYLGEEDPWRTSGATVALEGAGWNDAGHLHQVGQVVRGGVPDRVASGRRFFTLALPTEAPFNFQARVLERYVRYVEAMYPHETLILTGHSAGGVLGRLYMVQHPHAPIAALITIASPHLGTKAAALGLMAGHSPLGFFAPFVGGETLNRSQGLYTDLLPARPGSFLDWLNHQPHPAAQYIAVVREEGFLGLSDLIVPTDSQDMNQVYALRGQARRVTTPACHGLTQADGKVLVRLLRFLRTT